MSAPKSSSRLMRQAHRHAEVFTRTLERAYITQHRQMLDQMEEQACRLRQQGVESITTADSLLAHVKSERADLKKHERTRERERKAGAKS